MTSYAATSSNQKNTVTVTASDPAALVQIEVHGQEIMNGAAVQWNAGENTLVITVMNGNEQRIYTVTVVKEE